LWVARWEDKLSGKLKYVWLSDTAPIKQEREAQKFDKATALHDVLPAVRQRIQEGLRNSNRRRRMIAMACYLIDALCLRVGDEKDADEADTVGATTLRPEHVTVRPDGVAEFSFLGKDSVPWHKELELPPLVRETLEELIRTARPSSSAGNGDGFHPTRDLPQLFPDIHSRNINTFLSRVHKGLSAKVFRTYHATQAVTRSLASSDVTAGDPEYLKWQAAVMANLEAAILCNHTKAATGNWKKSEQRFRERLEKAEARLVRYRAQVREREEALKVLRVQATIKVQTAKTEASREKTRARYDKRIARAKRMIETSKGRIERGRNAIGKIKAQREIAAHKRIWNLNTSLKSYIDPRVYYRWGRKVEYDVIERYYPKTLRRKFAWVKAEEESSQVSEEGGPTGVCALTAGAPVDLAPDVALRGKKVPETAALVSKSAVPHAGLQDGVDP
jgi:DNA topoisomerase-1